MMVLKLFLKTTSEKKTKKTSVFSCHESSWLLDLMMKKHVTHVKAVRLAKFVGFQKSTCFFRSLGRCQGTSGVFFLCKSSVRLADRSQTGRRLIKDNEAMSFCEYSSHAVDGSEIPFPTAVWMFLKACNSWDKLPTSTSEPSTVLYL